MKTVKIAYISDIHREVYEYRNLMIDFDTDILLLGGDIDIEMKGVHWAKKEFPHVKKIIYIPGNHEYDTLDYTFHELENEFKNYKDPDNIVHVLMDNELILDTNNIKIRILGTTLWTDFSLYGEEYQKRGAKFSYRKMPEYKYNDDLTPHDTAVRYINSINWLDEKLKNKLYDCFDIVLTHHAPLKESIQKKFEDQLLTTAFANDLKKFISIHQPDFWIYGHLHTNFDAKLGKTRILSNCVGYNPNVTGLLEAKYIILKEKTDEIRILEEFPIHDNDELIIKHKQEGW